MLTNGEVTHPEQQREERTMVILLYTLGFSQFGRERWHVCIYKILYIQIILKRLILQQNKYTPKERKKEFPDLFLETPCYINLLLNSLWCGSRPLLIFLTCKSLQQFWSPGFWRLKTPTSSLLLWGPSFSTAIISSSVITVLPSVLAYRRKPPLNRIVPASFSPTCSWWLWWMDVSSGRSCRI